MNKRAEGNMMGNLPDAQGILRELDRIFARMPHAPIAVALFALPQRADTAQHTVLLRILRTQMLSCDSVARLQDGYACVLPGAALHQALSLAESLLNALALPCCVGVAVGTGPDRSRLLHDALEAVAHARASGMRLYAHKAKADALRKTLVRTDEKRFLFSGGD